MIVLDVTIVNVALPSVQEDLNFTPSGLAWVVNAYLIAFGGLLLLAGRLGDLLGRRNVFLAGLVVFTAASVLCGAAQNPAMLVVARFLQGAGGAMTSAVILGMIVTMFPDPRESAKAIGVYAFVASAGGAVGLLAGGVITQVVSWHWIFFVNLPIGIITAVCASRAAAGQGSRRSRRCGRGRRRARDRRTDAGRLHDRRAGRRARLDARTSTIVSGGTAIALLIAFVVRQAKAALPLMPLRIFTLRNVAGANVVQTDRHRRDVRLVLPGLAVPAARARLRPARDRPRVPAVLRADGPDLGAVQREAGLALRCPPGAAAGDGPDRRRARRLRGRAGRTRRTS